MRACSPTDSIEGYAELCASLDATFVDRASLLGAANLDEPALARLHAHWTAQLLTPCGEALATRFSAAYAKARSRPGAHDEDTWPSTPPAATEGTLEIPVYAKRPPALPFVAPCPPARRLHRFDTQTGLPLGTPYWIEDPG